MVTNSTQKAPLWTQQCVSEWEHGVDRCRGTLGQRRLDGAAAALHGAAQGPIVGLPADTEPAKLNGFCCRPTKLFGRAQRIAPSHERAELRQHS